MRSVDDNQMPFMGFEIFMTVINKNAIFCGVTPCSLVTFRRNVHKLFQHHTALHRSSQYSLNTLSLQAGGVIVSARKLMVL
jgi:hypothetical protein